MSITSNSFLLPPPLFFLFYRYDDTTALCLILLLSAKRLGFSALLLFSSFPLLFSLCFTDLMDCIRLFMLVRFNDIMALENMVEDGLFSLSLFLIQRYGRVG